MGRAHGTWCASAPVTEVPGAFRAYLCAARLLPVANCCPSPSPSCRPFPSSPISLFCPAMEEWRLKLMKSVQYACQLGACGIVARSGAASPASAARKLAKVATLLSLSHRSMCLGEWLGTVAEVREMVIDGSAATQPLRALSEAVCALSDLADDVRVPWIVLCPWFVPEKPARRGVCAAVPWPPTLPV